jgi:hypothetical protein
MVARNRGVARSRNRALAGKPQLKFRTSDRHRTDMAVTTAQTGWTWAQTAVLLAASIAIVGAAITAVILSGPGTRR